MNIRTSNKLSAAKRMAGGGEKFFWLLDDHIVGGIRKEGISERHREKTSMQMDRPTDRSNFLEARSPGTHTRVCVSRACVRKYVGDARTCVFLSLSLSRVYLLRVPSPAPSFALPLLYSFADT